VPLLVLIETISYLARAFSLGIRLFSNITAGHVLATILAGFLYKLFFTAGILISVITIIPFTLFVGISALEVAVSFIQAFVFTILTCNYLRSAMYLHG
jgi:F-type H+-transporting ATPase subunit a